MQLLRCDRSHCPTTTRRVGPHGMHTGHLCIFANPEWRLGRRQSTIPLPLAAKVMRLSARCRCRFRSTCMLHIKWSVEGTRGENAICQLCAIPSCGSAWTEVINGMVLIPNGNGYFDLQYQLYQTQWPAIATGYGVKSTTTGTSAVSTPLVCLPLSGTLVNSQMLIIIRPVCVHMAFGKLSDTEHRLCPPTTHERWKCHPSASQWTEHRL
jgi:hypothetical protein